MKRVFLILLLASFILTGCWDSIELNDIAVVTGIAIDPGKEGKYRLTVAYVNPGPMSKQSPEQGAPVSLLTLEGNTLPEMSAKMNKGVSRRLVFSHTRVLYINEKVAEKGVSTFLDSLDRSPQFRNDFNILVTKGNDAKDFTMINDPIERIPSIKTQKQIDMIVRGWGGDPRVRLTDFVNAIVSKGRAPVCSAVKITGDVEKAQNADSNMSIEAEAEILLDGMAVFSNDRLLGFLTLNETRNYLWTQDIMQTMVSIPCNPEANNEEKKEYFDLVITNSKTKMKTDYENGIPQLKLDIFTESRLNSLQCTKKDLSQISTYEELEKISGKFIEQMIKETIEKVQKEYKVDIFGFGEALERQHYDKAKEVLDEWDKEFSRGEVDVSVKVALRRAGTKNKSFLSDMPKEVEGD